MKHEKTAWTTTSSKRGREWGEEVHWSSILGVFAKILHIREGMSTSLKYNPRKNETFYVLSGKIHVKYGSENNVRFNEYSGLKEETLHPGDCLNVQSGCPYVIYAVLDSEVIEVGDLKTDNPVRIDEQGHLFCQIKF
jgi:mannose-6-phosphate isomerase-like protein (cupin superfamily)